MCRPLSRCADEPSPDMTFLDSIDNTHIELADDDTRRQRRHASCLLTCPTGRVTIGGRPLALGIWGGGYKDFFSPLALYNCSVRTNRTTQTCRPTRLQYSASCSGDRDSLNDVSWQLLRDPICYCKADMM